MGHELQAIMDREEFVPIAVLVRALQTNRRNLLRALKRDKVPLIRIGREALLHRDVVRQRYYSHHSGH